MKAFKTLIATAFFAASFSVHADASNATPQITDKNGSQKGMFKAVMSVNKPKADAQSRTLKPVK